MDIGQTFLVFRMDVDKSLYSIDLREVKDRDREDTSAKMVRFMPNTMF